MNQPRSWRGNRGGRFRGGNFRSRGGRGNRMNTQFGGNRNALFDRNQSNCAGDFQYQQKVNRETLSKRLSEEEIGVTEYLNDHEGFNGIIKSRYSDFQVSEINLNGEIAKLTNKEPPQLPQDKAIDEDEDLVLNKYNLEILPMETWDNINKLAVAQNPCTDKVEIDVTGMSKEQRTMIHEAVKKAFGKGIVGSTVTVDDKKYVSFQKYRKGVRIDKRVKWPWPGEYTYFVLYKENCDTMEAATRLAERLRVNLTPTMIGYAGTKDRRAKTSQWFSLRKVDPTRIAGALRDLREIHAGNYSFADRGLKLGMLQGNRFRIVLRNVTASEESVSRACSLLRRDGFLNYYGLQRFGVRAAAPTHALGLRLCRGELAEAIQLILEQRDGPLASVLHTYHTEGAAAAWRARGRRGSHGTELRLIRSLAADSRDLTRAIDAIPRNARLLYIHSYQSLIWNKVASQRVRRLGLKPAVGDLVPLSPGELLEEEVFDDEEVYSDTEENNDTEMETDDNKEMESDKDVDTTNNSTNNTNDKKKKENLKEERNNIEVKVLTQEDVDSGQYTLCDVVLPLPGYSIKYPPNMVDYYEELLTKDGLKLDMRNKIKQFSMSGAYRALAVRVGALRWRCERYARPHADLLRSDLDELSGRDLHIEEGPYTAVILEFTLPTCCYATMALRELLKVDTASDNQALQNVYHKVKAGQQSESEAEKLGESEKEKQGEKEKEKQGEKEKEKEMDCDQTAVTENETGDKRKLEVVDDVDAKKVKQSV